MAGCRTGAIELRTFHPRVVLARKINEERVVSSQDVLLYVKAQPFRPFRLRMASGRTFEIRHPEMIRVGRTGAVIFSYTSDDPDVYDKWETVSLVLIESIDHLEASVA